MRSLGGCMIVIEMQEQFTRRLTPRSRYSVERHFQRPLLDEAERPLALRSNARSRYSGARVQSSSTIIASKGRKVEAQVEPYQYEWAGIPMMSAHQTAAALSHPPDMAYLLLQSVAANAACFNNNNTNHNYNNNNNNNNNSSNDSSDGALVAKRITTSPLVSSTNQPPEVSRRRRKKDNDPPSSPDHSKKKSPKRDKRSAERNFKCGFCALSFGYKHVLLNHVRTHTGEKPFKCTEAGCGKRFTRDHHLKTHMRLHTGEKPYVCDFCAKRFVQVANLRRHMRVHTGERPYKCNIGSCEAKFSDSNQLNAHRLTHSGDEAVPTSEERTEQEPLLVNLRQRMGVLTIKHPNKCDFVPCGPQFLDPTQLNARRLSHSDCGSTNSSDEEMDQEPSEPLPAPIYHPPYQFSSQLAVQEEPEDLSRAVQEEPEDLSLKKSPRIAS